MGKNTKKINAGYKNPNNKSQSKAAKSFLRNRWWIEYKNVLVAIVVLSTSIFAATIFVNVKNEGKQLLFLKPNNAEHESTIKALNVLVPNKDSNCSYVILCNEHDNVEINKIWQKLIYSPKLVERKLNIKGAVVNCKERLPDGFFDGHSINFGANSVALSGNTIAEAFNLDMNQATPISFVVSYFRKPVQLQSNMFTSKDTLPSAIQAIELAVGVPKLWSIKNNAQLNKYCLNSNFAACGLILRYDSLAEDVKDVLSIIVRKYTHMNFVQVDMRKYFISIESKLPSRDSDTTAPHFLVAHTKDGNDESDDDKQQIAARAHRGFFTEANVDAFISQTLKRLSGDKSKIQYLKDELTISKRGSRDEKKMKKKEEEKKTKQRLKKKKKQKEEKGKAQDKKKREEKLKQKRKKTKSKEQKYKNKKKLEQNEKRFAREEEEEEENNNGDDDENDDDDDTIDLDDDPDKIEHKWANAWEEFNNEEG